MSPSDYTKGLEQWHAHYYKTETSSLSDEKLIEAFGVTLESSFSNTIYLGDLCDEIKSILDKRIIDIKRTGACFENNEVKYMKSEKYLRFPNFLIPELHNFVLRLDVNPCVGQGKAMTKIYCIQRISRNINKREAIDFFKKTKGICSKIIELISKKYQDVFNSFVDEYALHDIDKLDDKKFESPIKIIYRVLGSDDEDTKKYIERADMKKHSISEFIDFRTSNARALEITSTIKDLIAIENTGWKTSDFSWHTPSTSIITHTVHGYIGAKTEGNSYYYFGITDTRPVDLLMPLNIHTINSN